MFVEHIYVEAKGTPILERVLMLKVLSNNYKLKPLSNEPTCSKNFEYSTCTDFSQQIFENIWKFAECEAMYVKVLFLSL